jgi:hypothetical protein
LVILSARRRGSGNSAAYSNSSLRDDHWRNRGGYGCGEPDGTGFNWRDVPSDGNCVPKSNRLASCDLFADGSCFTWSDCFTRRRCGENCFARRNRDTDVTRRDQRQNQSQRDTVLSTRPD